MKPPRSTVKPYCTVVSFLGNGVRPPVVSPVRCDSGRLRPGGIASAQAPAPNSLPALQQSVAQRTAEWNTLATNLEQRVARLLPCDPQARAAIEEAGRASDARIIALTSYWTVASLQSKTQVEAIRGLLAQEEERAGDWVVDASQARADVGFATAQGTSLASSVPQVPALANPQKDLEAIAEQYRSLEKQAQERAAARGRLIDDLRELLNTSQSAASGDRRAPENRERRRPALECILRGAPGTRSDRMLPHQPRSGCWPHPRPRPAPQGKKQ